MASSVGDLRRESHRLPIGDIRPRIKTSIRQQWRDEWRGAAGNKLRTIRPTLGPWPSSEDSNRRFSVWITRLRLGHTRLTHRYLMEREDPPTCDECWLPLTVHHIMVECDLLRPQRKASFPYLNNIPPGLQLAAMISESPMYSRERLYTYLTRSGLGPLL